MKEKILKADGNYTIAANVVFHTTDIMLSFGNIAYLSDSFSQLRKIDDTKEKSSTEKLIDFLKENRCNNMVLYHDEKKISS